MVLVRVTLATSVQQRDGTKGLFNPHSQTGT
jgi:hypothetical protein